MLKRFSGIILFTDLDDTLLTKDKKISQKDMDSINYFIENGGDFSVATGRVYESAMQYIKKLNVTVPCVMYNGAMVYDTQNNEILWKTTLVDDAREYTKQILDAFPEIGAEILIGKEIYVPRFSEILKDKMKFENVTCIPAKLQDIPDEWIKVLFSLEHDLIPKVAEFVESKGYSGVSFVESCGYYYEMLPENVSKGNAIKIMLEKTDLKEMKIVAVGDYNNDIEMIKMANIGACVVNSPDEVKKVSDIVLTKTSDENALSELINYIRDNMEV